jgi:uncharacterized protein (DUF927 family)
MEDPEFKSHTTKKGLSTKSLIFNLYYESDNVKQKTQNVFSDANGTK